MMTQPTGHFLPLEDPDPKERGDFSVHEPAIGIEKVCKIAFHVLTALAVLATASVIIATVFTGTLPLAVLIVSSTALAILLTAQAVNLVKPFLPQKVQHGINVIQATVVDLFALLALAFMFPMKQSWFDPQTGDPGQTPILLVHGYLHNSSGWVYHRHHYKKAGFTNVFTVDLGHPFHSIEAYSHAVRKKVEEIREKTGRSDIRLIGHSMGGVVSAHYALHHAEEDGVEVKDLITLGSPLMGTRVGRIGVGKCAKQMCFGSDYISDLSNRLKESTIPHFHQGSKADIVILPHRSSFNDCRDKDTLVYSDLGHGSFLFSDRVVRANIHRLSSE
ncbi:putative membrane protein [Waddlia chondrophila 2032/99]|uniref:Putative membrane protein n=3 Tax=Waddlia chondrophila TaxID=71667 RepID=D6YU87_WADCW|nr:alpha/beta fold hydrolase [Waddlia chondrophila]ADI37698.1 putative membrane protein [Waddlia chondrophila WSU 86-1044]CCB90958.1 putative membrane protein [Waddlia chondrophila 2032/99]